MAIPRTFYFLCLFLLAYTLADAQHRRQPRLSLRQTPVKPPARIPPKPGWIISTNLFSLTEPDGGPSLAVEYRYSLHWAFAIEGTALLYTGIPFYEYNGRGFRIQPEFRYYFAGRKRGFRGFFSLQTTYKQKSYWDSAFVRRDNPATGVPFLDKVDYRVTKHVFAGAANIGFQNRFGKAKRIMFELYAGLGLKYKDFKQDGKPFDAREETNWLFPDLDIPGYYPHFPMGIRMGYLF